MKGFFAFLKKEWLEQVRCGRLIILGALFVLFGIMNPAVAKLTPWLVEMLSDSMENSGMTVTVTTVTAMDSWVQFYKNIPMALIAFVLIQSGIFTKEYQTGTLIPVVTKGLRRSKILLAKTVVLMGLWTVCYWICAGITFGYNAWYWDNSVAKGLWFSLLCWWLFGGFTLSLVVLFSTVSSSNIGVLALTGGVAAVCVFVGMLPKLGKYLPTYLTDGNSLIYGFAQPEDYLFSLVLTLGLTMACLVAAVPLFNKKQL
jgi:ABC-2 type transport system permease protein